MKTNIRHNKLIRNLIIAFLTLFSILFGILWVNMNKNIDNLKKQYQLSFALIQQKKDVGPYIIDYKNLNKRNVIINSKDIEKINKHVAYLSDHVYDESKRMQDLISSDIDRLNLYLAIGIGFMTIIGIFAPVLINVLSYQDLKVKQIDIERKQNILQTKIIKIPYKKIDDALVKSTKALEESTKIIDLSQIVTNIKITVDNSIPKVSTLTLQYAIIRYLNILPYIVLNFDKDRFIDLLKNIKQGFKECNDNPTLSILSDETLKSTISDFAYELNSSRNLTTILNKDMFKLYIELSTVLDKHIKVTNIEEEVLSYVQINTLLNRIIDSVKNYYAQTKPTT